MLNHDKLKQARTRQDGPGWKPKDGDQNLIRVLPPSSAVLTNWDLMTNIAAPVKVHYFKRDDQPTVVVRCPEEMKLPCPACALWRRFRKLDDDVAAKEQVKEISASTSYYMNILDCHDLQKGVQVWAANYTCWDKILEIAANPAYGNVLDPANGVNFYINKTPGTKTRTGRNAYSATPEPQRTEVLSLLNANFPGWEAKLDEVLAAVPRWPEAGEIDTLLQECGMGEYLAPSTAPTMPSAMRPVVSAPAPVSMAPSPVSMGAPAPVSPRSVGDGAPVPLTPAPVAQPLSPAPVSMAPAPMAPAPMAPAPAAPAPTPEADPVPVATTSAPATGVHYDPGPAYVEVTPATKRPAGAPRCFGDYDPTRHACPTCAVVSECQMKFMGF